MNEPAPGPAPVIGRPHPVEALGPIQPLHHQNKRAISRTCAGPGPDNDESPVSMQGSASITDLARAHRDERLDKFGAGDGRYKLWFKAMVKEGGREW